MRGYLGARWAVVAAWCLWLAGCGQREFGLQVRIPAEDRLTISQAVQQHLTLRLPDQPFNVHLKQSGQAPGPAGQARGESDATADGKAFCRAVASDGGTAWAEFQLGHALENRGQAPLQATIRISVDYAHQAVANPTEAPETLATLALKLYLKDSVGRIVHRQMLAELTSDEGPSNRAGQQRIEFDASLQPGLGYDLILAGRASARSQPHSSASAEIQIRQLTAELLCRPAKQTAAR
ncbi:MAG: hypothetical protein ACE5K7_05665 [Phycisphaerae bacterium]